MSSAFDPSRQSGRRSAPPMNRESGDIEQRQRPQPTTPDQNLRGLPAALLLDRLSVPMLAIGIDGIVVYNNPAFSTMLGHDSGVKLVGYSLPALLDVHPTTPRSDCVKILRAAGQMVVDWHHYDGFSVRSVVSETMSFGAADEILLIGVTDVTELLWEGPPEPRWRA